MPAGEGNLRIGATVDTGELNEGFTSVQDLTQKVTQKIALSFEEMSTKTKAAMRNLSDDVKAAADSVSEEALRVAEATKVQTAALADLRRASVIAKDAKVDDAESTSLLAAAQEKAAAASAELAAAKKAEADAVAEASEEAALSSNAIVRAFQRAEIAVSEALEGMRERLIVTAETANVSARDIAGGFSGLGELLGIGLVADFAGRYLDELAKMQVELGHLSTETGLSVQTLAGLQQIVKEMGGEWEPVERGLVRLNRAMAEAQLHANEASNSYVLAFKNIGISTEDLKSIKPDELLQRVATAFAKIDSPARLADSAMALFGRSGIGLIPVLKEQGEQLSDNAKKLGEMTGITDQSVEASVRWQRDTARVAAQFRSVMIPVLEHAGDVISGVAGAFEAAAFVIVEGFNLIGAAVVSAGQAVYGFGKLLLDATTGNFTAISSDVEQLKDRVVSNWKGAFRDIEDGWKEVESRFKAPPPEPPLPKGVDPGDLQPTGKHGGRDTKFLKDEQDFNQLELDQLKQGHQLTLQEEINFWKDRLDKAQQGSEEYQKILAKLARLEVEQAKHPLPTLETTTDFSAVKRAEEEWMQSNDAIVRSNQEAAKQSVEAFREVAEEDERLAQQRYQDVERDSEFEVQMGRETQAKRIAQLRQAAQEEEQARLQAVRAVELADLQNAQRYQEDLNKEVQITREATSQIARLNEQAALQVQNQWKRAFDKLNSDITQLTADWLRGTKNMGQQFAKMFDDLIINLAQFVEKWLLKKAEMWAEDKIMQLTGLAAQKSAQAAANVATVTGDAGVAAANTMAYYTAIDPPAAPALAAAAMAATLSFASLAAFEKGGVVGGSSGMGVPILAHAGERVLTAEQTSNFESLVNNHQSSSSSSNFHLHYNGQVNAYDRSGMRSTLKGHANDILDIVREGMRSGALAV